jgi:probable F420-dependent oxidoreductase
MSSSRARPVKVGLLLPETEGQLDGTNPRWRDILAMASAAEEVGFDSVWVTDHLIQKDDEHGTRGMWECWSLISALAASTQRVEVGTLVMCTGFRNPALLAKMADTVDEISGGRLLLGLGSGWNETEYHAFGYPFDHRVARFEEALQIISNLLKTGRANFEGEFYQAHDCELRPRGPRQNGPPILVGTTGPRMLELTARHADGWNVWFSGFNNKLEDLVELLKKVYAACEAVGRDPATLERSAAIKVEVGPHRPSPMSTDPISGSPEEIAATLRKYAEAGISHLQVWVEPTNLEGIAAFRKVLEELDA